MNGKKAKEQRKEGEQVAFDIRITCFKSGKLSVSGFPLNYHSATSIMQTAHKVVCDQFLIAAKNGKLNDNGTIEVSPIIQPSPVDIANVRKN